MDMKKIVFVALVAALCMTAVVAKKEKPIAATGAVTAPAAAPMAAHAGTATPTAAVTDAATPIAEVPTADALSSAASMPVVSLAGASLVTLLAFYMH